VVDEENRTKKIQRGLWNSERINVAINKIRYKIKSPANKTLCFLDSIIPRVEVTETHTKRPDFEMWVYRHGLLRIGWVDKIRNTEASWYLTHLGEACEISNTVKNRGSWIHIRGHPE